MFENCCTYVVRFHFRFFDNRTWDPHVSRNVLIRAGNTVLLVDKPIREWKVQADWSERDGLEFGLTTAAPVGRVVSQMVIHAEWFVSRTPCVYSGKYTHTYIHSCMHAYIHTR
jgi:hypothetical protein